MPTRRPLATPPVATTPPGLLTVAETAAVNKQTSAQSSGRFVMLRVRTIYARSAGAAADYYTRYLTEAPGEIRGRGLGGKLRI